LSAGDAARLVSRLRLLQMAERPAVRIRRQHPADRLGREFPDLEQGSAARREPASRLSRFLHSPVVRLWGVDWGSGMAIRGPGGAPPAWAEFRLLASVAAIGLVVGGMALRAADSGEPPAASFVSTPACQDADRASVAQLVRVLERNRSTDAPVLERA